jgi:hypothetical protein
MRKILISSAIAAALFVGGCAGDSATDPPDAADGSESGGEQRDREDESAGTDLDSGNEEIDGPGSPISMSVRDPLRSSSGGFQAGDLGHGAGLEYTGDAYRITNPGGPLFSPFQDAELAGLVDAHVSVEYEPVSGAGMAGVACAITDDKAYVFIAGTRGDGEPYYGIAYLDINERAVRALRDSNLSETPDAADVVPGSGMVEIGGSCEPGDTDDEAILTMMLDGTEVAQVRSDLGGSAGSTGLYSFGESSEPLVSDFNMFRVEGNL